MTANEVEVAVAKLFGYRQNLIVPNVSWGLNFKYEIDVLVLTPSNYGYEIEIKISASDLKRDKLKANYHNSNRIRRLYFAVPEALAGSAITEIPGHAGLIVVDKDRQASFYRHPRPMEARKFSDEERQHLHQLASMRIWTLKEHLLSQLRRRQEILP